MELTDVDAFDAVLNAYAHLVVEHQGKPNGGLAGSPAAAFAGHGANTALQAGIGPSVRPHYMAAIAERCAQVGTSLASGGAGDGRDLWYLGHITLASGCVDGDAYAHRLSQEHQTYNKADTDAALALAREERASKGVGLPTCVKYHGYRRGICESCPHWGHIKTPYSLGVENYDLPEGYRRERGWLEQVSVDKAGNTDWIPVIDTIAAEPRLVRIAEGYRLSYYHGEKHYVYFDDADMQGTNSIAAYFARKHITIQEEVAKAYRRFIVAWIKHLQNMMMVHDDVQPCTWTEAGFAVGPTLYQPDGSTRPIVCPDPLMAADFTPRGTQAAWTEAVNAMIAGRPDVQIVVAAGFAAPLVQVGAFGGGLIASTYSSASGTGKSTAAAAGQTVWTTWHANKLKLNDTVNAISNRLGTWHNMPQYIDEWRITGDEGRRRTLDILFGVSEGSDKRRLDRNSNARKVERWQSMCIITTNVEIMDTVVDETGNTTNAGALRLFSFPFKTKYQGDTNTHFTQMFEDNCGTAGAVYAAWLARNAKTVRDEYVILATDIRSELHPTEGERYYIGFITCILLGAIYARRLGLVEFDVQGMAALLYEAFNNLREERSDEVTTRMDSIEILNRFLSDYQQETVITDYLPSNRNKLPHAYRRIGFAAKKVEVHIAVDEKKMRISRGTYNDWCRLRDINPSEHRRDMIKQWRAKDNRSFTIGSSMNGSHTNGKTLGYQARVIELDLNCPDLSLILENAQAASTITKPTETMIPQAPAMQPPPRRSL